MRSPKPPGPRGWPLVGSVLPLSRDPLGFLLDLHNYGPVSFMRLGPYPVYTLNEPALIEEVLVGKYRSCIKDKSTRDVSPLTGQGLLTSEGELWRHQRKIAAPPLQPKRIAGYAATMFECAERGLDGLVDGEVRDIHQLLAQITLRIVGETLLGFDTRAEAGRVAHVLDVFMSYFERQVYSIEGLLPLAVPTWRRLQMRRAVRELDAVVYPIIERCRTGGSEHDHLLARLVRTRGEDGQPMSDVQLRDEAVTMLLAGHETTAIALTFAVYLLATHPAVAARLRAEVDGAFAADRPDPVALCALPYLSAVVRETLRLYPPVYAIGREVIEPFEAGGYTLRSGAQILISPYAVQRDARLFPHPQRFRPERWLDPAAQERPRFAFFPFGGGPRICIGNHFAMMELAIILASIVRRLELELTQGYRMRLAPLVTLRMAGGLPMRVKRRVGTDVGAGAAICA